MASITVILLKLRGKKPMRKIEVGGAQFAYCSWLLGTQAFSDVLKSNSCSEKSNLQSVLLWHLKWCSQTTIAQEGKDDHKQQMQKHTEALEGTVQAACGREQVPTKRPAAPGSRDPAPRWLLGWRYKERTERFEDENRKFLSAQR